MESYIDLAMKYVKKNKRRSIITICGVTVSVMVLYIILNLFWCYLINYRKDIRSETDYEIVLFSETEQQVEEILSDNLVKDATVGSYYAYNYYTPKEYKNAVYINTINPYRMEKILDELTNKYNVDGELNIALAVTYLQGSEANLTYIAILVALLISYICAIFGVGIIRNSIQLTMLENIKDFGNLRCIGASKGELKCIIYIQGALMEILGIVSGVLLGWIGSVIAGALLRWNHVGFHFMPIPFIALAFLGDLFFAMEENAKMVTKMTPVSAIRGEYRIKKEKLKRRRRSLWGLLFGTEGDYAYKNVRRHSGRFVRTVTAMSLGVAAAIFIIGIGKSLNKVMDSFDSMYGYYNTYYYSDVNPGASKEEMMKKLPPSDLLAQVSSFPELTESKKLYANGTLVADFENHLSHFTEENKKLGTQGKEMLAAYLDNESDIKSGVESEYCIGDFAMHEYNISCYGYDAEDIERYKDVLVDGTLDVSDNGLILVNGGYSWLYDDEFDRAYIDYIEYTDYKVGDKIEFIDTEVYRERFNEQLNPIRLAYEKKHSADQEKYDSYAKDNLTAEDAKAKNALEKEMQNDEFAYSKAKSNLICDVYNEVVSEGHTITYTVEGIVSRNINFGDGIAQMSIVLPLKNYYTLTGTDESWANGMMYHFDHFPARTYSNRILEYDFDVASEVSYTGSAYAFEIQEINTFRNIIFVVGLIVLFIVAMSIFNMINTTASDIYLRRKELAQLRVLGVSKKKLYKMVMLEGVIQAILSSVIGLVFGILLGFGLYEPIIVTIYGYHYVFPIIEALLSVVVTILILCGAVYVPLKRMHIDVASDLATAGE